MGILDVLLSVVAKSLTVQVKVKAKQSNGGASKDTTTVTLSTSINTKDYVGARWWLKGSVNRKLSEVIVHLLKDMASVSRKNTLTYSKLMNSCVFLGKTIRSLE